MTQDESLHVPEFWMLLNEAEARLLMTGEVPSSVREMARAMVDWSLETGSVSYEGLGEYRKRRRS